MWPNNKPWLIYPEEVTPLAALWITMTNCSWAVMVSIQWNWWNFRCKHGRESINCVEVIVGLLMTECVWSDLSISGRPAADSAVGEYRPVFLLEGTEPIFVLRMNALLGWKDKWRSQSDACAVMSLQARRGQMLSRQETSGLIDTNLCVCASPEGQNETSTSVWFPFPLKNLLYTVRPMQRYCEQ